MSELLSDVGEARLLRLVAELFSGTELPVGIGDDAAVVHSTPDRSVLAADAMVEGIHFRREYASPESVGRKLVCVNLSDMAAMGAVGAYATLTASMPSTLEFEWAVAMLRGVAEEAKTHGLVIVGGDVTGSPGPVCLSLSVSGQLAGEQPIRRNGARVGDQLYVTGQLGAAAFGLTLLKQSRPLDAPASVAAHRVPQVRCVEGATLAQWGRCHAMMDVSDGLFLDAQRLAQASQVALEVHLNQLPIHPEPLRLAAEQAEALAIHGGEDYELLFAASEAPPISATCIGQVISGEGGVRWCRNGVPVDPPNGAGFGHF